MAQTLTIQGEGITEATLKYAKEVRGYQEQIPSEGDPDVMIDNPVTPINHIIRVETLENIIRYTASEYGKLEGQTAEETKAAELRSNLSIQSTDE